MGNPDLKQLAQKWVDVEKKESYEDGVKAGKRKAYQDLLEKINEIENLESVITEDGYETAIDSREVIDLLKKLMEDQEK